MDTMPWSKLREAGGAVGKRITRWAGVGLGLMGAAISITLLLSSAWREQWASRYREEEARAELATLREQLHMTELAAQAAQERGTFMESELQRALQELARLSAKAAAPKSDDASRAFVKQLAKTQISVQNFGNRLESLDKRSGALDARVAKMEAVILADPQKALELPMLKRDLQGLQQQFDRDLNAVRAETGQVFDMMKWLIGLMALVWLSLAGRALGDVFRRQQAKGEDRYTPGEASDPRASPPGPTFPEDRQQARGSER